MKNKFKYALISFAIIISIFAIYSFCVAIYYQSVSAELEKKMGYLEYKVITPVVIDNSSEHSTQRDFELVKQAYQSIDHTDWFDFGYIVSFGGNDYGQELIFVKFYYSKINDPKTYKLTVCNYYASPDTNKWEVVDE